MMMVMMKVIIINIIIMMVLISMLNGYGGHIIVNGTSIGKVKVGYDAFVVSWYDDSGSATISHPITLHLTGQLNILNVCVFSTASQILMTPKLVGDAIN